MLEALTRARARVQCMSFSLVYPRENVAEYPRCGGVASPALVGPGFGPFSGQILNIAMCADAGVALSETDGLTAIPTDLVPFGPPPTSSPTARPSVAAALPSLAASALVVVMCCVAQVVIA